MFPVSLRVDEPVSRRIIAAMALDSSNTFFVKKGEFVMRSIAGETILVPVRSNAADLDSIYNLNQVAAFIWTRLDGQTNLRQLVEAVCTEFDVEPFEAENDALQLLSALQTAGMIQPSLPKS